ncbi:MAG: hypothetical protein IKW87_05075, partial [Ruminococcus sp.]|nr:hypothetical protein [Ruminococcus sp.]
LTLYRRHSLLSVGRKIKNYAVFISKPAVEGRRRRGKSQQMGVGEEGEREGTPSGRARFRGEDII